MPQSTAKVTVTGTPENPIFNFELPSGPKGEPGGWNMGTALGAMAQNNAVNLDDVRTPGLYYQGSTSTITSGLYNYPPVVDMNGASRGVLEVTSWGGATGTVIQRYTTIGTGLGGAGAQRPRVIYSRSYLTGGWSAWSVVTSQRVDNTAGRAIYTWDETTNREQMIYGDTGWRTLPLLNGYGRALQIRREGGMVTLVGQVRRPIGGSLNGEFAVLPPEFVGSGAWIYHPVRTTSDNLPGFHVYRKADALSIIGAPETGVLDATEVRFEISWSTTKPWPATLPGTNV